MSAAGTPAQTPAQTPAGEIGIKPWMKAAPTRAVLAALAAEGGTARFVGGCVRNAVLGVPVDDVDIATTVTPDEVMRLAEAAGLKAVPTGLDHGTVTVVADGTAYEVTTLRRDVETDGRHAKVTFTQDFAEDARRRDFTMNALYADAEGRVYDTVGGLDDARARHVRFVGEPEARIREDYLRILRFFRFLAWYGDTPDDDGLAACARLSEGLEGLSGERVSKELLKLLRAEDPVPTLRLMAAGGVLDKLLPEARRFELLGRLAALDGAAFFEPDGVLRLGALVEGSAEDLDAMARRLRLSNGARERIVALHTDDTKIVSYLSAREMRRAVYWMGPRLFADRVMLGWADDRKLSNGPQWRALLAMAESWQRPRLPLTGAEVMAAGVPEGKEVGRVLREVEEWWVDTDFTEDRFSIVERLKAVVQATVY